MESNNKKMQKDSNTLSTGIYLKDFIRLCIRKWKWFVLWVFIMSALTVLYLVIKQPVWKQSAEVLVKDQSGNGDIQAQLGGLASAFGLFGASSSVYNELIAMQSPYNIDKVVKRLHLDVIYTQTDFPRRQLYGSTLPVTVELQDVDAEELASFKMHLNLDGSFTMKKFKKEKERLDGEVSGKVNTTVQTPIGKVKVTANPKVMAKMEEDINLRIVKKQVMKKREEILKILSLDLESKDGTVLLIEYNDVSRERANDLINNIISSYEEDWRADKEVLAKASFDFISDRLMAVQRELGDYDNSIANFQSNSMILEGGETAKVFLDKASELEALSADLNSRVYVLEYIQKFMREHADNNQILPQGVLGEENGIELQIQQYNTLILNRRNIVRNSSEGNPILDDLDDQIASLRTVIIASIENSIKDTKIRLKEAQARENKVHGMITDTPQKINKIKNVGRNQQVKEAIYMFLLQKREENEMNMRYVSPNIRVLSPPSGVVKPLAPRKLRMLALGMFLGLLLPAIFYYVRESLRPRLRNRRTAERLNVPLLCDIPLLGRGRKAQQTLASQVNVKPGADDSVNNAFRTARTNLELVLAQHPDKNIVMFTSMEKGSGKTFATMNMAAALAINDKRVLVVDTDLRHAGMDRYLGIGGSSRGLAAYLKGQADDWKGLLQHAGECPQVDILPVGETPDNPAELIASDRFAQLLEETSQAYDVVLLDTVAYNSVPELPYIEQKANLVVVVLREGETEQASLLALRKHFNTNGQSGMVLLLNAVNNHIL